MRTPKKHDKMVELAADEEHTHSEDEILEITLGSRSGYQKGMRYGVKVCSENKRSRTQVQNELKSAHDKVAEMDKDLTEQKVDNQANKERIASLEATVQKLLNDF